MISNRVLKTILQIQLARNKAQKYSKLNSRKVPKLLQLSQQCPSTPTQQQWLPPAETGTFPHRPSSKPTRTQRNFQNTLEDSQQTPGRPNTFLPILGSRLAAFRLPIRRRRFAAFRPRPRPLTELLTMRGLDGESTSVAGERSRSKTTSMRPFQAFPTVFREEDRRFRVRFRARSFWGFGEMASTFGGKWPFS